MDDLSDHPFENFRLGEKFVSQNELSWFRFVRQAEKLLGHGIDSDQLTDGYSLDCAYDAYRNGATAQEYAQDVRDGTGYGEKR